MEKLFNAITIFTLLFLTIKYSLATDCSNMVTIESTGLLNYLANISFPAPHNLTGEWIMDMETDVHYTFLGGWGVWIRNDPKNGKTQFRSRKDDLIIQKGETVTFRFRISWFTGEPKPEVISLIWDGTQICQDNGITVKEIKASRARGRRTLENGVLNRLGNRRRFPIN